MPSKSRKFNTRRASALAAMLSVSFLFAYPHLVAVPSAAAAVSTTKANAALRYWVVFAQIRQEQTQKLREIDFDKLTTVAEVKAAFESCELKYQDLDCVGTLIYATRMPHCDFEVDMTLGPYVLMPHLSQIRTCSRLLRLDARRLELEGRRDEAATRIASILRMASHVATDKVMISSLVGVAVAEVGFTEGNKLLEGGKLSPAASQELEAALTAMDAKDPMLLRAAVAAEGATFPAWAERQADLPDGMARIQDLRLSNSGNEHGTKEVPKPLTLEEVRTALPQLRKAYESLDSVWSAPDPIAAAEAIEKRCSDGEFGILAKEWLPSMSRAYKSSQRFANERIEFLKKVQAAR